MTMRGRGLFAAVLCCLIAPAAVGAPVGGAPAPSHEIRGLVTPAEQAYQEGLQALVAGDIENAEIQFRASTRLDPGFVPAVLGLAEVASRRQQPADAERLIRKALEIDPDNPHALASLGRYEALRGEFDSAEALLRRAMERDATLVRPRIDLADLYATVLMRPEDARKLYEEVIRLEPAHAGAHYALGVLLGRMGETERARAELATAAELEPGNPLPLAALARIYAQSGEVTAALAAADRAVALDPLNSELQELRGDLLLATAGREAALAAYQAAASGRPARASAQSKLGMLYQQAGDNDNARRAYLAALAIDPDTAVAQNNLAWMAYEAGEDLETARDRAERAVALVPGQPHFMHTLGAIYRRLGRDAEAQEIFRDILEIDPDFEPAQRALEAAAEPGGRR